MQNSRGWTIGGITEGSLQSNVSTTYYSGL